MIALAGDSSPAATGRKRLRGCARSSAASRTSLSAYVPDDSRQNATQAIVTRPGTSSYPSAPAAAAAAITSEFLTHWRGRNVARTAWGVLRRGAEPSVLAARAAAPGVTPSA